MKIRVGVVGPLKSTHLIEEFGREFTDRMVLVPFIYRNVEETSAIIQNNEHLVDIWLFSGQMPYFVAQTSSLSKRAVFLPLDGSSLTNVLLHIGYHERGALDRLSLDTLPEDLVRETFKELRLDSTHIQLYPYSNYLPVHELITFHRKCYQKGMVDACITGIRSVYDALKADGIPIYRIEPTRLSIRQTLEMIWQQGETLQFQRAQIAVQVVQIDGFHSMIAEHLTSYDLYRLTLKLQEIVLGYTEEILGSFVALADNRFMIFSTRGSLEEYGERITALLQHIHTITNLSVRAGIGYGVTALSAEKNAYLALEHAGRSGLSTCAILIDERGSIHGPLHQVDSVSFSNRTEDEVILRKLERAGISIGTYNKILGIQSSLADSCVSSNALAEWMGMTKRNASRILSSLEKVRLAKIVGKETPLAKGRPRLIYRVGTTQS